MTRSRNIAVPAPEFPFRSSLHRHVLRWYRRHGRALPWREHAGPYEVMVSEFMLQQTQVARVREHLPRWLERFPSVADLARATRRDVLVAWSGMGYNRRALNLHEAALRIMNDHGGAIPSDPAVLRTLPGVGRYTAHAVACFGFRHRHAMVDVNIRRFFSRLTAPMRSEDGMLPDAQAWSVAAVLLPARAFYDWNQALMDLGAMICTARRPRCGECPAASFCASAHDLVPAPARTRSAHSLVPTPADDGPVRMVREVPRRIHRGRVIEHLRGCAGHCARADELHRVLFGVDGDAERARLLDIVSSLERDGLITALPSPADRHASTAPLRALRVCLAE